MKNLKIGIVILNYQTAELTLDVVKKSINIDILDEIVVIDNFSNDGSVEKFEEFNKSCINEKTTFVFLEKNIGYAKGNNIGLEILAHKNCDICFISNPDVFFEEETINDLVSKLQNNAEIAIVTASRRSENRNEKVRQYWDLPTYLELLIECFTIYNKFLKPKTEVYSCSDFDSLKIIDVAPGAFFAARMEILRKVNYFDSETFLYFEENCLSYKIKELGMKVAISKDSEYICLERKKNSTSKIQKTTFARQCYCESREHYARKYLKIGKIKLKIMRMCNKLFVLEKYISIKCAKRREK